MNDENDKARGIERSGFAAVIGAPNAGKSTLLNRLVGTKVAIVTHKIQTTRFPVRGIVEHGNAQIVMVDTPGIFAAKKRLDRAMVQSAWSGAEDADVVVHLISADAWIATAAGKASAAQKRSVEDDHRVMDGLEEAGLTAILALNKIDLFAHDRVLPLIAELSARPAYEAVVPLSAENGDGVEALLGEIIERLPEGPPLFPPGQAADLPERLLAAEITREKLMLRLHQELPYQLTVETETWEEHGDGGVRIGQAVIVSRDSHKPIVLGKGGQTIKAVSQAARKELAELLGRKVHLFLFVKVDERWQERAERYEAVGLDYEA